MFDKLIENACLYYNLLVDMCVCFFFFSITGFGDGMEESGFAQKNLVEVILVQEEEGGEEEEVESQSSKVKEEKVFNIHLQVSNTSTLASVSLKNQIRLNYGERREKKQIILQRRLRISQSSAAFKANLPCVGSVRACGGAADCTVLRSGH